jgi:undecaprenyl-diphosphatase
MRYRAFVPYSVLGCGLWVSAMVVIGYVFSRSINTAITYAGKGAFILGALIVVVVGAVWLTRFLRDEENRRKTVAWMEDHAVTRPLVALGRRYQRQLRFLGDRVTPGRNFGLEFTSLLAALAVALFVLVAYIVVVGRDAGPTPGDETAIEVAEALRCGFMTTFSKVLSALGSGVFVWALTLVCAAALAVRRRWTEVGVLVAGMALTSIGFHELKAAVDRPRPEEALIGTSGSSFPSGHAANSVLYVWLAVTIVVRLRPGMARAALVVVAGVALTALIGLSRVYLGAHYLSDVSGGWALGAAAFSICAIVGLLISQVRHNPG